MIHFRGNDLRVPTFALRRGISSVESQLWDFCVFEGYVLVRDRIELTTTNIERILKSDETTYLGSGNYSQRR